jgi:hypothetical protein
LVNCVLYANAGYRGGGAHGGTLVNCTVCSNSAFAFGGGVSFAVVSNSIIFFNDSPFYGNYDLDSTLKYCCTSPQPTAGTGNIGGDPQLVDLASGNLRLQSNSPCVNSGFNGGASVVDLDGNPRIVGGTVDLGAYEFQTPTSVLSYAWLQQYGLAVDGSADLADPDQDGLNNWQEWIAGTNPTNAASVLKMMAGSNSAAGVAASWLSVPDRNYTLFRSTKLASFVILAANIPGQTNTTTFIDTNAIGAGPFFYRVGVQGSP